MHSAGAYTRDLWSWQNFYLLELGDNDTGPRLIRTQAGHANMQTSIDELRCGDDGQGNKLRWSLDQQSGSAESAQICQWCRTAAHGLEAVVAAARQSFWCILSNYAYYTPIVCASDRKARKHPQNNLPLDFQSRPRVTFVLRIA